jgi:ureidoglycolate hydrolase
VLGSGEVKTLHALPLTPEAFATFGQVIQGYGDVNAVPPRVRVTSANQGSAHKFHKLSLLESSYPADVQATTGLSVYRCQPIDAKPGGHWDIKVLERHLHTNQAFIPMGPGFTNEGDEGLKETARGYLVVVAQNGKDDKPDLETMKAFIATPLKESCTTQASGVSSTEHPLQPTKLNSRIRSPHGGIGEGLTSPTALVIRFFSLSHSRWTSLASRRR